VKFLFCSESYSPHVGGVQEVVRQIAEHMVVAGHDVTVATRKLAERTFDSLNGVKIVAFDVSGNLATGMTGEVERYRRFLVSFPADALMIKAAQQWTFDASWEVLDDIRARKVFIPCGFSAFYEPGYKDYFERLPDVLKKFDHLIFYAERYRDIDYARAHGLTNFSIVPNGASEIDFAVPEDPAFRASLGIAKDDFVILTVGAPIQAKGHAQVAEAFARVKGDGRSMVLMLNGNWPTGSAAAPAASGAHGGEAVGSVPTNAPGYLRRVLDVWRQQGVLAFIRRIPVAFCWRFAYLGQLWADKRMMRANRQRGKSVLKTNLSRVDIIQAFLTADLFVFASKIEYSPLVLFEAAAAGTPFISVPVGNAEEIARWTGAGVICPARRDRLGHTRVSPRQLAQEMARLIDDEGLRRVLAARGREAWRSKFNWKAIAASYESVLIGQASHPPAVREDLPGIASATPRAPPSCRP
jgi:glycosyltransferase involved in cell wall biosynthesis